MMGRKIFLILAAVLFLAAAMLTACGGKKDEQQAEEVKLVKIQTAGIEKITSFSELSGLLEPSEESAVSFEATGRILEMGPKEGDRVGTGDFLARMDATEYSLQVAQAGAGLEKASAAYQKAKEDFSRLEQLYNQGALSKSDFEGAQVSFTVAERDYLLAQESYSLVGGGKDSLKSPISGTVIARLSAVGQVVAAGTTVYRVGQIENLKVILPVPDREISRWKAGGSVTLSLYQDSREGKVTRVYPATNQGTGTIGVEVTVANNGHDWHPGQVVRARFAADSREGLFIPVEAVLNHGLDKPYVFLASGDKAVKTPVTTGELFNNQLEITSGIKPGDQVVVKGSEMLFDGNTIKEAEVAAQ
ncbi:MAG TPA: efflux RND transporter periplasmic adaptor subunit [Desulfotomaculum sp.]|nr:efflux RND transporter periplasmic adaptor subunit [Desulfotomaculum sp.]